MDVEMQRVINIFFFFKESLKSFFLCFCQFSIFFSLQRPKIIMIINWDFHYNFKSNWGNELDVWRQLFLTHGAKGDLILGFHA